MSRTYSATKNHYHTKWNEFEFYDSEPKAHAGYNLTSEDESAILSRGLFLKARVRRNMQKYRGAYSVVQHDKHRPSSFHHAL